MASIPFAPRRLERSWLVLGAVFLALFALVLVTVRTSEAMQEQQRQAQWWRAHTLDVLLSAERMDTAINRALRGERGYVLTRHPASLETFRRGLRDYAGTSRHVHELTGDNRVQQERLAELDRRVRAFAALSSDVVARVRAGDLARAMVAVRTGAEREAVEDASAVLEVIKAEERRLLSAREARNAQAMARTARFARVSLALVVVLILVVAGVVTAMLRARAAAWRAAEEVRASERRYRLLADNATDVVLRTDEAGTVTYISPSCVDLSGFTAEELTGRLCAEFIHPEDHPLVQAANVAIVTGAESAVAVEYRLRHKDGDWRWLESHMKPWRAPGEAEGGVISAIRDIDRRKALEAELVAARDAAEAAARAKSAFLANMSHEIRTPMNGVLGFTELVLAGDLAPDQRRHLELIAESGRSMMRLLNDILDKSKIDAGRMHIAAEPVDLRHVVRRCADLMAPAAQAKGVRLSAHVDPAVPARLVGDPLRLRQILLNLVGNALKFTERGGVAVNAAVDGDRLRLDVIDTGIGIPPDRLQAIFHQFAQADESTAGRYGGTGLGLAISGDLARLMGGAIEVTSAPGQGSTFSLVLPLRVAADPVDHVAPSAASPGPATAASGRAPRVLIAEDHDINQVLILAMAERAGMAATIASDGLEAVALVEEAARAGRPYDLVLMDMQMPRLDGLEATRRLRLAGHDAVRLPIVALTANAYAEDVQACLAAGMQAHLAKPVQVGDLAAVLTRFVTATAAEPAAPASPPKPLISPKLRALYAARKAETLRRLDELAERQVLDPTLLEQAAELLHKLAGTAATFGEAALGDQANDLAEALLSRSPADPVDDLRPAIRTLADAMRGPAALAS
jgi:PAS domain S-box-containing protein